MLDTLKIQEAIDLLNSLGVDVTIETGPHGQSVKADADYVNLLAQPDGMFRVRAKYYGVSFDHYMAWSVIFDGWSVFAYCCTGKTEKGKKCGNRAIGHCISPRDFKPGKDDRCRLHQEENAKYFLPTEAEAEAELSSNYVMETPDESNKAE